MKLDPDDTTVREIACPCCGRSMRYTARNLYRLTELIEERYPSEPTPSLNIGAVARSGIDLTDPAVTDDDLRGLIELAVTTDG